MTINLEELGKRVDEALTKETPESLTKYIQLEICKQLRIETGYGLTKCKKALIENDWEFEKAKDWLTHHNKKIY